MTRKEKIAVVEKLVAHHKKLDAEFEKLDAVFGKVIIDAPIHEAAYHAISGYIDSVAKLIGDEWTWLYWYIYDNDFGEGGLAVKINGKARKCKTVAQLIDCIEKPAKKGKA